VITVGPGDAEDPSDVCALLVADAELQGVPGTMLSRSRTAHCGPEGNVRCRQEGVLSVVYSEGHRVFQRDHDRPAGHSCVAQRYSITVKPGRRHRWRVTAFKVRRVTAGQMVIRFIFGMTGFSLTTNALGGTRRRKQRRPPVKRTSIRSDAFDP